MVVRNIKPRELELPLFPHNLSPLNHAMAPLLPQAAAAGANSLPGRVNQVPPNDRCAQACLCCMITIGLVGFGIGLWQIAVN